MKLTQHYSGSSGNCYVLELASKQQIIIDPGVTFSKLKRAIDFDLSNVTCCLLSHRHLDHSKAARDLLKAGIPLYASMDTIEHFDLKNVRNVHPVKDNDADWITENIGLQCFGLEHDALGTIGFYIVDITCHESFFYATDTAFIRPWFKNAFTVVAIEASYQSELLLKNVANKKVSESVAKRLLDAHMEFSVTLDYLKKMDLSKCRELHLIHCSKTNFDVELAKQQIRENLFMEAIIL